MADLLARQPSAVGALNRLFGERPAQDLVALAVRDLFPGRLALTSSFGAEAVVLLHMVSEVAPALPVLFLDTGKHFAETLRHRDTLIRALGLTGVVNLVPDARALAETDPDGTLHAKNPDACCAVRKVAPLQAALKPFEAVMGGRRRAQSESRAALPVFEADGMRTRINPIAGWSDEDVALYIWRHQLPVHPLVEAGYPSIGCAPCTTRPVDGDGRSGRWAGFMKTECGIHGRA
ncbi:MAG: phosphoadenylyl-sulfate reductase [Pseudomonadota bacterium]